MPSEVEAFTELDNSYKTAFTALDTRFNDYWMKEPDGKASNPHHAYFSSLRLGESSTALTTLIEELTAAGDLRTSYWRGPGARAFGRLLTAYRNFITTAAASAATYSYQTLDVNSKHLGAIYEATNKSAISRYTTAHNNDFNRVLSLARLIDSYGRYARSKGARHPNLRATIAAYDAARSQYVTTMNDELRTAQTELEQIRDNLAAEYLRIRGNYDPVPPEPDFEDVDETDDDSPGGNQVNDLLESLGLTGGPNAPGGAPELGGAGGGGGLGDAGGLGGGGDLGAPGGGGGLGDVGGPGGLGELGGPGGLGDVGGAAGGLGELGGAGGLGELGSPGGAGVVGGFLPPLAGGPGGPTGSGRGYPVVTNPDGTKGLDLNGDGRADVGLGGPGREEGLRLVTGPDGTVGYDITGNDVPDLALDLHPLHGGDLPSGSALITGADGSKAIDINGDGIPDVTLDGRAIPGTAAPSGGQLATGPDGVTGFDLDGDGIPDVGFDGSPLSHVDEPSPDPDGFVPTEQVRMSETMAGSPAQLAGSGYPMIPPMMGGMGGMGGGGKENAERERQTWLQEDDEVWRDEVAPVASLGRPIDDDDDDDPADEWARKPKQSRQAPRTPAAPRGYQPGVSRR